MSESDKRKDEIDRFLRAGGISPELMERVQSEIASNFSSTLEVKTITLLASVSAAMRHLSLKDRSEDSGSYWKERMAAFSELLLLMAQSVANRHALDIRVEFDSDAFGLIWPLVGQEEEHVGSYGVIKPADEEESIN